MGQPTEVSWAGLVELLSSHKITPCHPCPGKECVYKNGPAWVPSTFGNKRNLKGNLRHQKNVLTIEAGVLDFDHLTPQALETLLAELDPFKALVHTSHSHKPEDVCIRVVLELSRPVTMAEWPKFYPKFVSLFGSISDPKCLNGDRIYYLPSCSAESEHWALTSEGTELVDVDAILSVRADDLPPQDPAPNLDVSEIRKRLMLEIRSLNKAGHTNKAQLLKRVIDAEPLAQEGERDDSVNRAASQLAWVLPPSSSPDICISLMYASISLMPHEGEGLDHWLEKAKDSFVRAQQRRAEIDEERRLAKEQLLAAMSKTPQDDWQTQLAMTKDNRIAGIGPNLGLIFQEAEQFQGAFRFNEVTKDIDTHWGTFSKEPKQTLHIAVSNWLYSQLGIQTDPQTVKEQIAHNARKNSYDPLKEWLLGLEWDGVKRLQGFFTQYCGSPAEFEDGTPALNYYAKIGPKWFLGAVARALDPGQLVKAILVLEGTQNKKKSALLRALAGAGYFSDSLVNINSKESTMLISRMWIIELAEMSFMRGTTSNEVKSFISRTEDYIRPPYGAVLEAFQRRAILVGTINDKHYLEDHTGNVRYWPVVVDMIDVDKVLDDREQLWAEAVALYQAGEQWWLEGDDVALVEAQTNERLPEDPIEDLINRWWLNLDPSKRPAEVNTLEVLLACIQMAKHQITNKEQQRVGRALRKLGFKVKRNRKQNIYVPSADLLAAPRVAIVGGL